MYRPIKSDAKGHFWVKGPMRWLLDFLGEKPPQLGPEGLDCVNCEVAKPLSRASHFNVKSKCCDFSPFVSAFAMGAELKKGELPHFQAWAQNTSLLWTSLGLIHTQDHYQDLGSLCELFEKGKCAIWENRPPTCYSFFCAGMRPEVEGKFETWAMEKEANLLKAWFDELGLSLEVWEGWCIALDRNPGSIIPEELILEPLEALEVYKKAYEWLNTYSH